MSSSEVSWRFPLPSCHHGIPLGNGRTGALLWGEGRSLRLTIGRPDFWEHRGGMRWTSEMSFGRIRSLLAERDEAGLRKIFESAGEKDGPARPTILPVGRVEIELPDTADRAELDLHTGVATIRLRNGSTVEVELDATKPVIVVRTETGVSRTTHIPAAELCQRGQSRFNSGWADRKLPDPERFDIEGAQGFAQALPVDPALGVASHWRGKALFIAVSRGADARAAFDAARSIVLRAAGDGAETIAQRSRAWWSAFWSTAPRIRTPNAVVNYLAGFGMYKLAASTNPLGGVPCGLQGPWIEDDGMPAWSSDYHFNINVQLCYAATYPAGAGTHLKPLWEMLRAWEPQLRENARLFVGIDDGLMLPHAVDDRGTNMGGFWTGTVDHACTAWVAKMMYDAWRYGFEDEAFLRDRVQPWLEGALNVYRAMSERKGDGSFAFPVSVSPEYRGSAFNAWGENASAQLAACHALLDALEVTCAALDRTYCAEWTEFRQKLPRACIEHHASSGWNDPKGDAIALWKGTPLEESHRHHSHLFGITPFESIDPHADTWQKIIDKTLGHWVLHGQGWWAGWSFGWASQIHARVGNAVAAVMMLEHFARYFVNDGHAGFHNALHRGLTIMGGAGTGNWGWNPMQLDGGQGACAAVFDLLAHDRHGVVALFAGCPREWADVSFDDISLPRGFHVSATRSNGQLTRLHVRAKHNGDFRYYDPATNDIRTVSVRAGVVTTII